MGQGQHGTVAQAQIHAVYLKVTVGMMRLALTNFYVGQITATLHFRHTLTAATSPYQVQCFAISDKHVMT